MKNSNFIDLICGFCIEADYERDQIFTRSLIFLLSKNLLGRGVFGDGFGSFRDGVLGQFSGKQKSDGSLDFPRSNGAPLVVVSETRSFGGNAFEDVVHEGVHD